VDFSKSRTASTSPTTNAPRREHVVHRHPELAVDRHYRSLRFSAGHLAYATGHYKWHRPLAKGEPVCHR
jgi:hypothetical protein